MLNIFSRSKSNQARKFGQLTECNMINIFPEKSFARCGEETIPRSFSTEIKIDFISESTVQRFIQFVFIVCQVDGYPNILKLSCKPLAEKGLEPVSLPHFLHDF